jgi:hypothetical protein
MIACIVLAGCGRVGFGPVAGDISSTGGGDSETAAPNTFGAICGFSMLTAIQGGYTADDMMIATMLGTFASACGNGVATRVVSQTDPGILDASDRPLLASADFGLMGGGHNFERGVAYLDIADTQLKYNDSGGSVVITERATGTVLVDMPDGNFSGLHDVALIMIVVEAASGSDYLVMYGVNEYGTQAAGYYVTNMIAPSIRTNPKQWYLLDWTDNNGNFAPDAADTYAIIASRP